MALANSRDQGAFSDRFGKKWFIVAGGIFGIVGNIVAGTASSVKVIIAGQALTGVGASLFVCQPASHLLRSELTKAQLLVIPAGMEIVSAKNRSFAQGGMGLVNGVVAIVGLIEGK